MATQHDESMVLLTGYPSFGARQLANHLLAHEPGTRVFCVVRDKFRSLAEQCVAVLPAEQRQRMLLLEGDAAGMDMGLSGAEFREVTSRIDRLFHFAQVTYPDVPSSIATWGNVQSAREAIELAKCAPRLRCLVMLSTASVAGNRSGLVLEQDLEAGQSFRTVVEETKAHAERIARRAMGRLPIVLLRPSTIIGDSETGEVDRFDGPYPLILLILSSPQKSAIPLPIRGDLPLNLVPIDFVVSAARRISVDPRAPGRTVHLVDPSPLSARRVFELVAHAAGRRSLRGIVPSYVARSLMRTPGLDRVAKSPRAYLQQLTTDVRYDARNAEELLRGTSVVCPPFESYVDRIVNYVRTRIREQRRREADASQAADDPLS